MTANKPSTPRRFAAATLFVAAGAVAASLIGPTSIANAQGLAGRVIADNHPQLFAVPGFQNCVDKARSISLPGHDDQALQESCCSQLGGFLFHGVCVSTQNVYGDTTEPPAVIIAGHGADPTRLNNN
jgi:hypothetical protein